MGIFRNRSNNNNKQQQQRAEPTHLVPASVYNETSTTASYSSTAPLSPPRKTAVTRTPVTTPPGHNKHLRDTARYLLGGYAACMLWGAPRLALAFSSFAVFTMYQGTVESVKNLLWGFVVWTSLPTALLSTFLFSVTQTLVQYNDEQQCDGLCLGLWVLERGIETFFGFLCAFVLFLTAVGKMQTNAV